MLSDKNIKNPAPAEKSFKVFDGGVLYIKVYPNGSKIWRLQSTEGGKETRKSLGPWHI
ncbi:MAG: Arm DNA-binding domain-containing protein [Deltaproteobacteria bacterium]|nr:Arm DNA-binding domain-containing protein [Deltaproteobacteria bacterium]